MARAAGKQILIRRINLWWYGAAAVPIAALVYLGVKGIIPSVFAPLVLFLPIFWLSSLIFAIFKKLRGPRQEPRQ